METKKFRIRAATGSPDEVTQGNLTVRLENGHYETDHARFAEFLTREYGAKEDPEPPTDIQPTAPSIPRPAVLPAANKPANETNTGGEK